MVRRSRLGPANTRGRAVARALAIACAAVALAPGVARADEGRLADAPVAGEPAPPVTDPFRFRAPEGFVDADTPRGRKLEPEWPAFCGEEGIVACTFSPEFEDDGSRAFAYAKLVPGSQPVSDALLAKLARAMGSAIDARDAVVVVDEAVFDRVAGHRAGRILATVTAAGRTTKRWVWVMATPTALAMITYVAPEVSFAQHRASFEASARASEGVIDGVPLFLQAVTRGQGKKGALVVLYVLLAALVLRVVMQASGRRRSAR
jgi:hypothetical protein